MINSVAQESKTSIEENCKDLQISRAEKSWWPWKLKKSPQFMFGKTSEVIWEMDGNQLSLKALSIKKPILQKPNFKSNLFPFTKLVLQIFENILSWWKTQFWKPVEFVVYDSIVSQTCLPDRSPIEPLSLKRFSSSI